MRVVLTNTVRDDANPWLRLWRDAELQVGVSSAPLSWRAVARSARGRDGEALHLQWPERSASPPRMRGALRRTLELVVQVAILRASGRPVLLTMHNTRGHDAPHPRLESALWWALTRLVSDVHTFAAASRDDIVAEHPALASKTWHEVAHGDYAAATPTGDAALARARFRIRADQAVVTTFGQLRPYKGTLELIQMWRARPVDPAAVLVVAGVTRTPSDAEALEGVAGGRSDIRLALNYQTDQELADLLSASQLVVLPYRRVLTSGSALMALTAGRRLLVPDTGWFRQLDERVGPGWIVRYGTELEPNLLRTVATAPEPVTAPELEWATWERVRGDMTSMWGSILP